MKDELREKIAKKVKIEVVDGVGGFSLYINDTRIAGPKPLGGGRAVASFCVTEQTVNDALPNLAPILEKAQKYDEAYSRWPSIVDHERWWKETKEILETREVKDGQ